MDQTAGDTRNKEAIVDLQLDRMLQFLAFFLKHAIESFCLRHGPWKSIKNETEDSYISIDRVISKELPTLVDSLCYSQALL